MHAIFYSRQQRRKWGGGNWTLIKDSSSSSSLRHRVFVDGASYARTQFPSSQKLNHVTDNASLVVHHSRCPLKVPVTGIFLLDSYHGATLILDSKHSFYNRFFRLGLTQSSICPFFLGSTNPSKAWLMIWKQNFVSTWSLPLQICLLKEEN